MGQSWNSMRKVLEQENICDSLNGRIQYFATRYRESHDETGRVAIRLDGEEIFKSNFFDWDIKRHQAWREINMAKGRPTSYNESGEQMELEAINKSGITQWHFYNAFHYYHNHSIKDSLNYEDPIVRLFAIFDKRVGKRTLQGLADEVQHQPSWLQVFYKLRLEADGISKIRS